MLTEGRVLYDADKLGRLSGLAVVTSLIELGRVTQIGPSLARCWLLFCGILKSALSNFISRCTLLQHANGP